MVIVCYGINISCAMNESKTFYWQKGWLCEMCSLWHQVCAQERYRVMHKLNRLCLPQRGMTMKDCEDKHINTVACDAEEVY